MDLKFQIVSEPFLDIKKYIPHAINDINKVLSLDCVKNVQRTIFGESRMITKKNIDLINKNQLDRSKSYYQYEYTNVSKYGYIINYIEKNVHGDIIAEFEACKSWDNPNMIIRSVYINDDRLIPFIYHPQSRIESRTLVLDFTKNTGGSYTHAEMYRIMFDKNINYFPNIMKLVDRHTNHKSLLRIDYSLYDRVVIDTMLMYRGYYGIVFNTLPLELRKLLIELLHEQLTIELTIW